jgi:serine phosphatase RsbU (regulator of sigma subunit)
MFKLPILNIGKISLLIAILIWLALLFVDISRIFGIISQIDSGISIEISWILEISFFIMVYIFYNYSIQKSENNNFLDMIWRGATTGILATAVSLLIMFFYFLLGETRLATDPLLFNFFYHVNFAFITIFLISSTLLWRHLILYQKNKRVVQQWQFFEITLLISMFFIFFNKNTLDYSFLFGLFFLLAFGTSLSANLKWIPYLTFKEKWKSILFLGIILICTSYLFFQLLSYSEKGVIFVNLTDNLFMLALFGFVFIYTLFSFLVTFFNLPTSSVFEQKLLEVINFQRLSRSIKPGENESQVLDILVDSCMSAAYVDAAWLELRQDQKSQFIHQRFVKNKERKELYQIINMSKPFLEFNWKDQGNERKVFYGKIQHPKFKSAMVIPLVVNKETIGRIFLTKEVKDGFNKEMINIISTFVGQACISVENSRLLNEAIKNERYKEELKIAQQVQRSLLPSELNHDDTFEIFGFSEAADEVGGDYYDSHQIDANRFAVIIGDVSGKGTSAAFNMSQMKGIFHSLVQIDPSPSEFLIKANTALSKCLEKNHFITTTYYILDTKNKNIYFSRAGHCPTLFFDASTDSCEFLRVGGMGLGIVRNKLYENYVHENEIQYEKDDILVMYTDGILEAKDGNGQEFGYDRLKALVKANHSESAKIINEKIIQGVFEFIGENAILDDDYSVMVIRFNR